MMTPGDKSTFKEEEYPIDAAFVGFDDMIV